MANALDELKEKLITEWDEADEKMKIQIRNEYSNLPDFKTQWAERRDALADMWSKYSKAEMDLMHESSEDIHKANVKAADKMINNLVQRVEKKIGKITSTANVYTNYDNEGFVILNGYFTGENGSCEVESIRAGGWNVQKRHIRVLVK